MKFNKFLKNLREKNKLTQEEASSLIGVNIATIQNWERGSNKPELTIIPNISETYSIPTQDILNYLALDLELIKSNYSVESETIKYLDVLPNNIDIATIEGLKFTEREQDLFLIFVLNIECLGNPIPQMSKACISNLELALFFDKMQKYNIYYTSKSILSSTSYADFNGGVVTKTIGLTEVGQFIFNKIKELNGKLFSVYDLNLKELLDILNLYYTIKKQKLPIKSKVLYELVNEEYYLEEYKKRNTWSDREEKCPVKSTYIDNFRKDCLNLIDSSYYTLENVECSDEMYLLEKETYLKKLDFYEKNKDLAEGLIMPTKYEEKFTLRAYPTEKAIRFMQLYTE